MFMQYENGELAIGTRRVAASSRDVAEGWGYISHAAARERALAVFAALLD